MFVCSVAAGIVKAVPNPNEAGHKFLNNTYFSPNLWGYSSAAAYSTGLKDYRSNPTISMQRNITVWATGLPNKGRQKRIYRLERGVRYKVRVSQFTHFGTWRPTGRALKNDACYEFNARSRKVSLPVVKTNYGFNFCLRGYRANHVYESQVVYGRRTNLVMWVYDTDYRDNYGSYYVEVIELVSRR